MRRLLGSLLVAGGIAGVLVLVAFGLIQLAAGFIGIEESFGTVWAWIALAAALLLRFTLPTTVGAFLCALNVWEWHWLFALLFALPGLLFMVPGVIAAALSAVRERRAA